MIGTASWRSFSGSASASISVSSTCDHGACLGFHHRWSTVTEESPRARSWSPSTHVLGSRATRLAIIDTALTGLVDRTVLESAVGAVPAEYLSKTGMDPHRRRAAYVAFLWKRLKEPRPFLRE